MELSQAHLRYLLAIGRLAREQTAVSSAQVARALQVSRPSVTRMLTILAEKDLVTKERYGKITLTETGAALARQLQAGLRDLERRLPALGLELDREETAAVAGALAAALPEHCLRKLCTTGSGEAMGSAPTE
ncbi:MAG TPA: MarR family transcriptional regulator [Candidatus Oscillibacter excrementavium]|nr:MarR family transcriptional regulator [Candidatus Oscillibacter excrementavium]